MNKIPAKEAAKMLGVDYNTLVRYIETKQIKGTRDGRSRYVSSTEIKRVQKEGIDVKAYKEALKVLKAKKAKAKQKKAEAKRQAELAIQAKQNTPTEKIPDISLLIKDKYTVKEAGEFLGHGKDFIQRRIRKGEITVITLGRQLISRDELVRYVNANYSTPDPIEELGGFEIPDGDVIDVDSKLSPEEKAEDEKQIAADQKNYEEALAQGFDPNNPDEWYEKQWKKDEAERKLTPYTSEYKLSFCVSQKDYELLQLVAECRKECVEHLLYSDIIMPFRNYILHPRRPHAIHFYSSDQYPSANNLMKIEVDKRINKLAKYEGIPLRLYIEKMLTDHIREYSPLIEE